MRKEDVSNKLKQLLSLTDPESIRKEDFFELLFEGCCLIYGSEIDNEDLYVYPVNMYALMSAVLAHRYGYGIEESKAWLQFDVLEKLKDPKFFERLYDKTISAYQGLDGKAEDILLPFIEKAESIPEATILGTSVWYIYADFLERDSLNRSDKTIGLVANTLCFLYQALSNVKIV